MEKLENNVLQRFMFELIEVLKEYNETTNTHTAKSLNIPFIISTLYQNFSEKADKYDEFIQAYVRLGEKGRTLLRLIADRMIELEID